MPVYEFSCNACGAANSFFVRSINAELTAACTSCGSSDLRRLLSRFAYHRRYDATGSLDDDRFLESLDEHNPRAMAAWARRLQREMGGEDDPEFEDIIDRIERGETPESLDLPLDDGQQLHDHDHDHDDEGLRMSDE